MNEPLTPEELKKLDKINLINWCNTYHPDMVELIVGTKV